MSESLQHEIRHLYDLEGSDHDPERRAFLPLADALLHAGELDEAEQLLVDGLERHPEFVAGHVVLARLREAQGDPTEAERVWAVARRLDPGNAEVLYGLGRTLTRLGEEFGRTLVDQARALDPTVGPATADDEDVVSIAALAPEDDDEDVVSIAALAPEDDEEEVVSIAALAPDG
ncbi:MAG: tetratricopeptide repeat protein, partial [Longimicrobiales bacterium]|nr:tetratricopeptide repeat protein [Longimicrobiales bacterium]